MVKKKKKNTQQFEYEEAEDKKSVITSFSLHRKHFVTCCSAFDQLGAVVAQMPGVEQLFTAVCVGSADNQPAVTQSLQYVRGQVEGSITEFTTWKTELLSLGPQNSGTLQTLTLIAQTLRG